MLMQKRSVSAIGSPPRYCITHPTIGSHKWQNSTIQDVKLSQTLIGRSNKNCELGRSMDPLPQTRDTVAELSNQEASRHFREVRLVVNQLQESSVRVNEEIKLMMRVKESLDTGIQNRIKDIQLNRDSIVSRSARPFRERDQVDGADDLLHAERQHLLNLKKSLESHLRSVREHLMALDATRSRLMRCTRERSRALDLICHTRSACTVPVRRNSSRDHVQGAGSRPVSAGGLVVDPLGALTPEVQETLREANDTRADCIRLRTDLADSIAKNDQLCQAAHASVNNGLRQKLSETNALKHYLTLNGGKNRLAMHRAQRWYDSTQQAHGLHLGPESSADYTCRERLTRPIMNVFQRHPGSQVPEAHHIIQGTDDLADSLHATGHNIQLLRLAQARLSDNIREKSAAAFADNSVLRMRRRKADHRWIVGQTS